MISAIVVAAGKSLRMGQIDKLQLPFKQSTIINTVIENLLGSKVDEIIVVTNPVSGPIKSANDPKIKLVTNPSPDQGLTSSIQYGVKTASPGNILMICLGDMPLLENIHYNYLIDNYLRDEKEVIIQPFKAARPGNPVLFSWHFRNEILELTEPHGCRPVVQANQQNLHQLNVDSEAYFTDIDTLDQYKKLSGETRQTD